MRTGTLSCWLFGHVFLAYDGEYDHPWDWCRKCGLSKEDLLSESKEKV